MKRFLLMVMSLSAMTVMAQTPPDLFITKEEALAIAQREVAATGSPLKASEESVKFENCSWAILFPNLPKPDPETGHIDRVHYQGKLVFVSPDGKNVTIYPPVH